MRTRRVLLVAVSVGALAAVACNPFRREPVTEVSRDANLNERWRASLVTPSALVGAVQINGSATMQPGKDGNGTRLSVNIANATPGGVHPWQVRRGQCGADEGVFGTAEAYSAIKVSNDGRGSESATVSMNTPTYGRYFVTVQASTANAETVVACGNLAPPSS